MKDPARVYRLTIHEHAHSDHGTVMHMLNFKLILPRSFKICVAGLILLLFRKVFGSTIIAVLSSMLSYLFAQYIDIHIYHFWKNLTKGRMLWLRNNFSTFFSQFVDTFTILFLLCITNVLSWDQFAGLLISGFLFKVLVALVDTPFLYLGVYLFRRKFSLKVNEELNID